MEKSTLELLLYDPMKLREDINCAMVEVASYKQECQELHSHVEKVAQCLHKIVYHVKHGNGRFSKRPTTKIVEDVSKALEKCLALVRRCRRRAVLGGLLTIITSADFRSVMNALKDSQANVEWLINVATDDDPTGMHGLPPIVSACPNLAPVWAIISNLQGGTLELREGAVSALVSFASGTEQIGDFFLEEGGVPDLLRIFKDGTIEAQINTATALGDLAVNLHRVRRMSKDKVVPALVHVLECGSMRVQAKAAWAMAQMVSLDKEIQMEFGKAYAINHLVALMLETMGDMFPLLPPIKAASLQTVLSATLLDRRSRTDVDSEASTSSTPENTDHTSEAGDQGVAVGILHNRSPQKSTMHTRNASDSPYYLSKVRGAYHKEREKENVEVKEALLLQVTRTLWFLTENNIENSRVITETAGVLAFAKLIEREHGEVRRHAIMAVMQLAEAAEADASLRKSAFKKNSAAATAVKDQLLRIVKDPLEEPNIQVCCITALGCLGRSFSTTDHEVVKCIVTNLVSNAQRDLPAATAAVNALLKLVNKENYLYEKHSKTIVESLGLPYIVQLAVLDAERSVQIPAILLLSQLVLHVGSPMGQAFQEAAALSVLRVVAGSPSVMNHVSMFYGEELLHKAIHHLEFNHAGENLHTH